MGHLVAAVICTIGADTIVVRRSVRIALVLVWHALRWLGLYVRHALVRRYVDWSGLESVKQTLGLMVLAVTLCVFFAQGLQMTVGPNIVGFAGADPNCAGVVLVS